MKYTFTEKKSNYLWKLLVETLLVVVRSKTFRKNLQMSVIMIFDLFVMTLVQQNPITTFNSFSSSWKVNLGPLSDAVEYNSGT